MRNSILILLVALSYFAFSDAFKLTPRIVGDLNATTGQFPYYAYIEIRESETRGAGCGASLINDEWLITAAHCLVDAQSLKVYLGQSHLEFGEKGQIIISVEPDSFAIHPEYNQKPNLNDIALIHLPRKIEFSKNIEPINLPTDCNVPENVDVIAVGHGATSDKTSVSMQLKYAKLQTIPSSLCARVFPFVARRKSVICATSVDGSQSVCRGDSGGPLVTKSESTLVGVSAFIRREGCETGLPQGFTNIYSYLNWIKEVTGLDVPEC